METITLTYHQYKIFKLLEWGGGVLRYRKIAYNAAVKLQEMGLVVLGEEYKVSGYVFVKAIKVLGEVDYSQKRTVRKKPEGKN